MPSWGRPGDIHFDHDAAEAAVAALVAARFSLEVAWAAEDQTARAALASWEGRAAEAFETSHAARGAVTEEVVVRLGLLQSSIESAIDDAVLEQARIDVLQAEWDDERRREIEAARAVEEAAGGRSMAVERQVSPGIR